MIEIRELTKTFGDVKAVNNITLSIHTGVNGLVGENGAGKSTLLRVISDIYNKDNGEILIDNLPYDDLASKKNLFFLSDTPYFPSSGTAKQTFDFYATLFDLDKEAYEQLLEKLSLPMNRKLSTFSKGMRRQIFLAIALSAKAKYILLDEAFDGLDPVVLDTIKQEIIKNADEKTYIVSSHNITVLERLCDNFILLSKGRCAKTGNIEHLGENFVKYQIFVKDKIEQKDIENLGYKILSFKKLGSIYNVVFYDEIDVEKLNKKYDVILCEKIPIDPDELIALEMLDSRKEAE